MTAHPDPRPAAAQPERRVLLRVEDLEVGYGPTPVLFGVSLEVPARGITCLMGRNGVGKTTLLNAMTGLLPVRGGRILLDGEDITRLASHRRTHLGIGYVPQGQVAFPHLTARENLVVVAEAARWRTGTRPDTAVDHVLELFPRLRPLLRRPAGVLSGGERQQLAMARALAGDPRLLLLDEPTEGIQPSIITEIEDIVATLHREHDLTILLVEQYVAFALRLATSYAVMEAGRIVDVGSRADLDPERLNATLAV